MMCFELIIPSLLMASLNLRNISIINRRYMFAIAAKLIEVHLKNPHLMGNLSSTRNLLTDSFASFLSFNSLLQKETGIVSLERCTTAPLEHTFVIIRLRAKYHFRIERIVSEMNKVNTLRSIRNDLREQSAIEVISQRISNFGSVVSLPPGEANGPMDSIVITTVSDIIQFGTMGNKSENLDQFMKFILYSSLEQVAKTDTCLRSSNVVLAPSSLANIKSRITAAVVPKKSCSWSRGEVNLLWKLRDDFEDNVTKISKYFPLRTIGAVKKKIDSVKRKKMVAKISFFLLKVKKFVRSTNWARSCLESVEWTEAIPSFDILFGPVLNFGIM